MDLMHFRFVKLAQNSNPSKILQKCVNDKMQKFIFDDQVNCVLSMAHVRLSSVFEEKDLACRLTLTLHNVFYFYPHTNDQPFRRKLFNTS